MPTPFLSRIKMKCRNKANINLSLQKKTQDISWTNLIKEIKLSYSSVITSFDFYFCLHLKLNIVLVFVFCFLFYFGFLFVLIFSFVLLFSFDILSVLAFSSFLTVVFFIFFF